MSRPAPRSFTNVVVLATAAFALACGGDRDDGPHPATVRPPWLDVGTGRERFAPVPADGAVPIIRGIQGGVHVWGAFRGAGFPGHGASIRFAARQDGEDVAGASYLDDVRRALDGAWDYAGVAVIFFQTQPELYDGKPTELSLRIEASDGTTVTDSVQVIPRCCE
jgi:hypothetical protein